MMESGVMIMEKSLILNRVFLPLLLSLCFMLYGLESVTAGDSREPADLPDKQSSALAFVTTEELPDDVVEVAISQFTYKPSTITVESGTTIVWRNQDPMGHNASFVAKDLPDLDEDLAGPIVGQGISFAVKFSKTGTYNYYCTPHPFMQGVVIVE